MKIDNMIDIMLLLICLVIGASATVWSLISINGKITDYTMGDKIAIEAMNDNTPEEFQLTTKDILFVCVLADENQPYPSNIQVNSNDIIEFNNTYFADTNNAINNIWNVQLSPIVTNNVKSFNVVYDGGKVRWKIVTE